MHSPHPGVWREEIPQSLEPQVAPAFSLRVSAHHPLHCAGDQVDPHPALYRQNPYTDPPGLGKELKISIEWKNRYLR